MIATNVIITSTVFLLLLKTTVSFNKLMILTHNNLLLATQ